MFTKKTVKQAAPLAAMALAGLLAYACSDDSTGFAIPVVDNSNIEVDIEAAFIAVDEASTAMVMGIIPYIPNAIQTVLWAAQGKGDFVVAGAGDCPNEKSTRITGDTEYPATIAYTGTMVKADGTTCNVTDWTISGSETLTTTGLGGLNIAGLAPADLVDLPISSTANGFFLDIFDDDVNPHTEEQWGTAEAATGVYNAAGDGLTSGSMVGGDYWAYWEGADAAFTSRDAAGVTGDLDATDVDVSFDTDAGTDVVTVNGTVTFYFPEGNVTITYNDLGYDPLVCGGQEPTTGQVTIGNAKGETVIDLPAAGATYGAGAGGADCGLADVTYPSGVAATPDQQIW